MHAKTAKRIAPLIATASFLSGCELSVGVENISTERQEIIFNATTSAAQRAYDELEGNVGFKTDLPPLHVVSDDKLAATRCDSPFEIAEVYVCPVDNKLVINPKTVHAYMRKAGMDSKNPEELNAYTQIVVAHEIGHIAQILSGLIRPDADVTRSDIYALEIQADCLAGALTARNVSSVTTNPSKGTPDITINYETVELYKKALAAVGDNRDASKQTHGSSTERLVAYDRGLQEATALIAAEVQPTNDNQPRGKYFSIGQLAVCN